MNRQHMLACALFWMLMAGWTLLGAGETAPPQASGDRSEAATAPSAAADAAAQAEKRAAEELAHQFEAWKGVRGGVRRALESHKENVRLAALDALEGIDHPGAASQLKACVLEDRSPYVAEKAAELLGLCTSDAVMAYVTASLKQKEEGCAPERPLLLAEALAYMDNPGVLPFLKTCLHKKDTDYQLIGLMGLARFARLEPDLIPPVAPLARQQKDRMVQMAAVQVLGRIPDPGVLAPLIEAAKARGPVGEEALAILRRLTGRDFDGDPAAWEAWYRLETADGTPPELLPPGGDVNTLAKAEPAVDPVQGDKPGVRRPDGGTPDWDSSTARDGSGSRHKIGIPGAPDVDFRPPEKSDPRHKDPDDPMEIIPLRPGKRIRPATRAEWKEKLDELEKNGLDVVILFDSTGSMVPWMRNLKRTAQSYVRKLFRLVPNTRISICTYRDRLKDFPDEYVVRGLPLTKSVHQALRYLKGVEAAGGGDHPEAVDRGLQWAIRENVFRAGATKVIVLMGDAPPHNNRRGTCNRIARRFRRLKKGTISVVHCWEEVLPLNAIARNGGGQAYLLFQPGATVESLMILVFGQEYAAHVRREF